MKISPQDRRKSLFDLGCALPDRSKSWYEQDPKLILYGVNKLERWTTFAPDFGVSNYPVAGIEARVAFVTKVCRQKHYRASIHMSPTMTDSGVASPTNDYEHFPSLEDRARSSSRMFTKSGRASSPTHSACGSLIRASIVRMQNEKKAKKVRFYRNGDRFFKGMVYAVSPERFRTFESLLAELTSSPLGDRSVLPNGVRHMFSIDGTVKLTDLDELEEGESYVCASTGMFKRIDYPRSTTPIWNPNIRSVETPTRELSSPVGHNETPLIDDHRDFIKPKLVTIIRNGSKPRKAVRILLNKKTAHTFEQVLTDITDTIKLDSGTVKKIFTIDGKPVTSLLDFFQDESVFIAYGSERHIMDDFDLNDNEVRFVSAYRSVRQRERITLKSPKVQRRIFSTTETPYTGYGAPPSRPSVPRGSPSAVRKSFKSPVKTKVMHVTGDAAPPDLHDPPPKLVHKYKIGKMIGEGNFATVRECLERHKRKHYALKIIDKLKCKGKEHMIQNELAILRKIKHNNIVQLIEDYENSRELYLIMELIKGGDLFDAIAETTKYTERDASGMLFNLASALKYLHNHNIVHRDIKPENLMVYDHDDGRKSLKLGDFGLATECNGPLYTVCGTPTYVAPEIVAEQGYGKKVDVWSAGVITYILLCGFPPFVSSSNDQEELFDKIMDGEFRFPSPYWDDISESAKELINGMLCKDPANRYSASDVLDHPWVSSDDTAKEQDLNIKISAGVRKPRKFQGTAEVAILAATALDKGSRYFEGRGQMQLQSHPDHANEVF